MCRKLLCLLLCAALLCPAALAATYDANLESWEAPNYNILFNDEGELLMLFDERYVVSRIGEKQDWFSMAVESENPNEPQYALINAEGEQVTDRLFDGFHDATLNTVIFREGPEDDCRYGLLNSFGEEILPAEYSVLEPFGDTHLYTVDSKGLATIISEDGTHKPTGFTKMQDMSGWGFGCEPVYAELLAVANPDTMRVGFIDTNGEWVIPPQFAYAGDFETYNRGLAVVRDNDGKTGLIDMKGNIVIPVEYDTLLTTLPLYIEASKRDSVTTRTYDESSGVETFTVEYTNETNDFYTWDGQLVLSGSDSIHIFGSGFYDFEKEVYLDSSGNEIALDVADYCSPSGFFAIDLDPCLKHKDTNRWHMVTRDWQFTETSYNTILKGQDTDNGTVYVASRFSEAPEGDIWTPPEFRTLLDMDGNELVSFDKKILYMEDIRHSEYLVFQTESTIGVIDTGGNILLEEPLPPAEDEITDGQTE